MPDTTKHHKALIAIMFTMSAVDRTITDRELARIGNIVKQLPIFEGFDEENLVREAQACGEILGQENGLDVILNNMAALPPSLYETAYALAVEVAAADLEIKQEELRFLQILRDHLHLDKLIVSAIERGARARHMRDI